MAVTEVNAIYNFRTLHNSSDHRSIVCDVNTPYVSTSECHNTGHFDFKCVDFLSLKYHLSCANWHELLYSCPTVDSMLMSFLDTFFFPFVHCVFLLQAGPNAYINLRCIHREGVAPLVNKYDNLATSNNEKAEVLNSQFSSVFTTDDGTVPILTKCTDAQLFSVDINPERVRKFMCKLPAKFSCSPDGIPTAVLKLLSYERCIPLHIFFKTSLDSTSIRRDKNSSTIMNARHLISTIEQEKRGSFSKESEK